MRKKNWILAALSVLCTFLLSLFSGCSDENMAKAKPNVAIPVTVGTVLQKAVPVQLRAIGNAQAFSTVTVKALIGGEIIKVSFREGQDVNQGDLLFVIDPRPYEATLRQAEANLAKDTSQVKQAKAALERDQAQVRQAEANLIRDRALAKNAAVEAERYSVLVGKNVVSRQQYDQFRTAAETSDATVQADNAASRSRRP